MACTAIGCDSQLEFVLSADLVRGATYDVEACIAGDCTSASIEVPASGFAIEGPFSVDADRDALALRLLGDDYSGSHTVSLTVTRDGGGVADVTTDVEFERQQPNGPGCEPVCWFASVRA